MARERWPKALRSSGANQRALRSVCGVFLVVFSVIGTPVGDLFWSSHRRSLRSKPRLGNTAARFGSKQQFSRNLATFALLFREASSTEGGFHRIISGPSTVQLSARSRAYAKV